MLTQVRLKEIAGKTVVAASNCDEGTVFITFADGTFLCIDLDHGYDGDVDLIDHYDPFGIEATTCERASALGIITPAELAERKNRLMDERDAERRRREKESAHAEEMRERYLLHRLKEKYEGVS